MGCSSPAPKPIVSAAVPSGRSALQTTSDPGLHGTGWPQPGQPNRPSLAALHGATAAAAGASGSAAESAAGSMHWLVGDPGSAAAAAGQHAAASDQAPAWPEPAPAADLHGVVHDQVPAAPEPASAAAAAAGYGLVLRSAGSNPGAPAVAEAAWLALKVWDRAAQHGPVPAAVEAAGKQVLSAWRLQAAVAL